MGQKWLHGRRIVSTIKNLKQKKAKEKEQIRPGRTPAELMDKKRAQGKRAKKQPQQKKETVPTKPPARADTPVEITVRSISTVTSVLSWKEEDAIELLLAFGNNAQVGIDAVLNGMLFSA